MKSHTLICIDRDGTLIEDNRYYLGSQKDWKKKFKFFANVIKGLKKLKSGMPKAKIYMITNQTGVAVKNFQLLTISKAHEVCKYTLEQLQKKNVGINGYMLCPHANKEYMKRRNDFDFKKIMVCECDCIKPRIGIIKEALKKLRLKMSETKIYVIGDRATDVHTALNAKGCGILIPYFLKGGEVDKVRKMNHKNTYVAKDFLRAVDFILERKR